MNNPLFNSRGQYNIMKSDLPLAFKTIANNLSQQPGLQFLVKEAIVTNWVEKRFSFV